MGTIFNIKRLFSNERLLAIIAISLALCIAVLDGTIVNIALPTIAHHFNISTKNSIWIVNAYQLAVTICLLPLASLGDIYGYKKVYCGGLGIFCAASLICAVSSSFPALTLARVIQGIGAAGILSVNAGLIRLIYPPHQLGRGIGINAFIIAISAALGPTIAALILSVLSWHWLFAINVPISLLALYMANKCLPESNRQEYPFDFASAILCAMTFSLLVITIDGIGHQAELLQILSGFFFSGAMLWILIKRELSSPAPLLPIDLLRLPIFAASLLTSTFSFVAQMSAYVSLPFYFIQVLGLTIVKTGLYITPWPIAIAISAPVAGLLSEKYPAGILGTIGLGLFSTGLILLARLQIGATPVSIIIAMSICGCGFGFFQAPNNKMLLSAAPLYRSGAAGGLLGTGRILGQTIGATLAALIFGLAIHDPNRSILYIASAIAGFAALLSLMRYGINKSSFSR